MHRARSREVKFTGCNRCQSAGAHGRWKDKRTFRGASVPETWPATTGAMEMDLFCPLCSVSLYLLFYPEKYTSKGQTMNMHEDFT